MSQKQILLIVNNPYSLLSFRGDLIDALIGRNYLVHIAAPQIGFAPLISEELKRRGVVLYEIDLHRTSMNPIHEILAIINIYYLVKKIKPDIVFSFMMKPIIYGSLVSRVAGVKHRYAMIEGLGNLFISSNSTRSRILRRFVSRLYKLSLFGTERIFLLNKDDRNDLLVANALPRNSIITELCGIGVDLDYYRYQEPADNSSFLMIGRLFQNKGVREFEEAARMIKQNYPNQQFVLVGSIDDNSEAVTRSELDSWISTGVIQYLGELDDIRFVMAQCSVFVLPSYREGLPRTSMEAMAMGRPIITTDVPGCRETIRLTKKGHRQRLSGASVMEGENGFMVRPRDSIALAKSMAYFIKQPSRAAIMGKRSRIIAEEKFDVSLINSIILSALDS